MTLLAQYYEKNQIQILPHPTWLFVTIKKKKKKSYRLFPNQSKKYAILLKQIYIVPYSIFIVIII
jgi:hypothetical protein